MVAQGMELAMGLSVNKPVHNGNLARLRAFAVEHELFSALDIAAMLGITRDKASRMLSLEMQSGRIYACGKKGAGLRRYTLNAELAAKIEADRAPKPISAATLRRKVGACIGGMRTLADIEMRCTLDEDTDCLVWPGATTGRKPNILPTGHVVGSSSGSLVRAVWTFANEGKPLNKAVIVWRTCTNKRCLNHEHMSSGTRKQFGKWLRESGRHKARLTYQAANRIRARRTSKISDAVIKEIRASDLSTAEWAARLGVLPSSVSRALKRTELLPNASAFSMVPA